jgi:DNA-binding Lrp family transcriptional regulator
LLVKSNLDGLLETRFERMRERTRQTNLDAIDLGILRILQDEARLTKQDLAVRIGMTPAPCLRRLRRLESKRYILGYHAKLDRKTIGFEVLGFVSVGLENQGFDELKAFEHQAAAWPQVRECHATNGDMDFLLKCVTRNMTDFGSFVTDKLMRTANVKTVRSSLVIRTSKDDVGVPLAGIENMGQQ